MLLKALSRQRFQAAEYIRVRNLVRQRRAVEPGRTGKFHGGGKRLASTHGSHDSAEAVILARLFLSRAVCGSAAVCASAEMLTWPVDAGLQQVVRRASSSYVRGCRGSERGEPGRSVSRSCRRPSWWTMPARSASHPGGGRGRKGGDHGRERERGTARGAARAWPGQRGSAGRTRSEAAPGAGEPAGARRDSTTRPEDVQPQARARRSERERTARPGIARGMAGSTRQRVRSLAPGPQRTRGRRTARVASGGSGSTEPGAGTAGR